MRGMRHPQRQPRVPGLPVRYGPQHGPLLQPLVPGSALEGTRAPLRSLPVPPLQVERLLTRVDARRWHNPLYRRALDPLRGEQLISRST